MKKNNLKIVLIGAGSREFSRGLVNDLVLETGLYSDRSIDFWMVDIDPKALKIMSEYARKAAETAGAGLRVFSTTDRRDALPGADYVLVSVEQRRMELWEQDFRLPLAFGMKHVYGENGGPGAIFHTLRNYEILFPILEDVAKLCPGSLLLNFTNPETRILKAILTLTKVRAIGLCHGFYDFHRLVKRMLGKDASELDIRTAGMNHFFTYYRIEDRKSGKNMIPEFERVLREKVGELPPLSRYFWETFGVMGIDSDHHIGEYIPYAWEFAGLDWLFGIEGRKLYHGAPAIDANVSYRAWHYRMDVRSYLESRLDKRLDDILSGKIELSKEDIVSSGELAVPVIADIELDRGSFRSAVNLLNTDGYIPNLDRDACIEIPAVVDARGIHPEFAPPLPEGFAAQVRLQNSIQKLIVEAHEKRSRKLLLQALLLDPVVTSARDAERFLDAGFRLQAEFLPTWH